MKKIHIIYFSSSKHFKYLIISLRSLIKLKSDLVGHIYLYIDEDDCLNEVQIRKLNNISPLFILKKTNNITGWGKRYIFSELKAFNEVSNEIPKDDYIAKADSDIIFLNSNIFELVIESDKILVGFKEASLNPFIYTQGGLYFIKSFFIRELLVFDQERIFGEYLDIMKKYRNGKVENEESYAEDAIIYMIISGKTNQILFLPFMNIPALYKQKNPSIIHFMKSKNCMWLYFYGGDIGLTLCLPYLYFKKAIDEIDKLMGMTGRCLKSNYPKTYIFLKPYFPDRSNT